MVTLNIHTDLMRFADGLNEAARRQVRFGAALALRDVTTGAIADMKKALPSIFDRPVPFTMNAFYAPPVKRKELTARVEIKFTAPKGTPAEKYLAPEILGGGRNIKRFERRLANSAGIPGNVPEFTLPAAGALLDRYGNMQTSQIGAILGNLRAFGDTGQNIGKAKLRRLERRGLLVKTSVGMAKYFVAKSKTDGRPLGVYNFLGPGHVVPVLLFARRPPVYTKRLDFDGFFLDSYRRRFPAAMKAGFARAMATAMAGRGAAL